MIVNRFTAGCFERSYIPCIFDRQAASEYIAM